MHYTKDQVFDHVKKLPAFSGFDPSKLMEFVTKLLANPLFQMLLALLMKTPAPAPKAAHVRSTTAAHEDLTPGLIYSVVMCDAAHAHLAEFADKPKA